MVMHSEVRLRLCYALSIGHCSGALWCCILIHVGRISLSFCANCPWEDSSCPTRTLRWTLAKRSTRSFQHLPPQAPAMQASLEIWSRAVRRSQYVSQLMKGRAGVLIVAGAWPTRLMSRWHSNIARKTDEPLEQPDHWSPLTRRRTLSIQFEGEMPY